MLDMKFILKFILCKIFFPNCNDLNKNISLLNLLEFILMQKIIGFNRNISWPVHFTSQIKSPEKLIRGSRYPGMSQGVYIDARNGIKIDENVWIGPKVSIISMNHDQTNLAEFKKDKPIVIGKNSWIGAGAIILPGVELGANTIVGAGAVVTKSFKKGNTVIGGNPAINLRKDIS